MKLFRFDADVGKPISQFDSKNLTATLIARTAGELQVVCMVVAAGGVIGRHPATVPQLFLVVQGDGWVEGSDGKGMAIQSGQAAFWEAGEEHQSGTDTGVMAIILEGADLDPTRWMVSL